MTQPGNESTPDDQQRPEDGDRQVSSGPSGSIDLETSQGGADAVPDTPDALPSTSG